MGVSRELIIPLGLVVSSSNAVARNLWGFCLCADERAITPTARASNRLAANDLLRYKFMDIFNPEKTMQVNDKAPEFTLANEEGKSVSLKDYRGHDLVLFFYPKANTPG